MGFQSDTLEPSSPDLSPPVSQRLEPPRQGHLLFDEAQRITRVSSGLRELLRLAPEVPLVGELLPDMLELAAAPGPNVLPEIEDWLQASWDQPASRDKPSLILVTATHARTLQVSLEPLSEQSSIVLFEDVTAEVDAASEMFTMVYRDGLTGAANRRLFETSVEGALASLTLQPAANTVVFFLDLDRFKVVNDTLGHATGDHVLRLVSERIQSLLRPGDLLARLGGDEFALLLSSPCDMDVASTLAARIIELVLRPYLIGGHVVHIGVSIGIAVAPADGNSKTQLFKSADLALYHSKDGGRGVFSFFTPAMEEKAQERRLLELDLRKALILRQFEMHYQPQIDVETQAVIGLEGLLRWRHPTRGIMPSADFIPLAEELAITVPIGEWMLKIACKEAKRWPESVRITVNITARMFEMETFAASVQRALLAAGLPGSRFEIDVTEDILLRDGESIIATLNTLRTMGVSVAMDRFGTGLASMSQLVNFPFDKIKIDPSLTDMHAIDPRHRAIVRAVSALGESLGISTLAEGVETPEQLAQLRADGCQSVQGFYYSEALPASELAPLFAGLSSMPTIPSQPKDPHEPPEIAVLQP